ncbi:MAG: apolipoprotein N-acyltransferase [Acidobacteriota bacterium]
MIRQSRPDPAWGLILASAAASFLAFANPVARLPLLVLVVPWVLSALARQASGPKRAFKQGWLAGSLGASASLYWIAIPVHDYGALPWILAVPCPVLMGMVLGLYPAAFCSALHVAGRGLRPLTLGVFAGLAWTALEALRGWLFTGFPWFPLAAALAPWPLAIQGASLAGAYGLSGLLAACGAWLAGPGLPPRVAAVGLAAVLSGYGLWSLDSPVAEDDRFNAAMIQGNIEQAVKWDPETLSAAVQSYIDLSMSVASSRPDIYLWPETALTFFVQEPGPETSQVKAFVQKTGVPLVSGAPGFERVGKATPVFNRAYLFSPQGTPRFYDKQHLVPFGEYAPFGQDIPILSELLQGVGAFTPGHNTSPLKAGRLAMGMLICYESIFPELAQERVSAGANVLVNISNDAWFGNSAAPRQHLELATLRAVEQNRFVLRATNTGITALIDPKGRVSSETALFQKAAVAVTGVGLITRTSPYHYAHGWLEAGAALAALAMLSWAAITTKRTHGT